MYGKKQVLTGIMAAAVILSGCVSSLHTLAAEESTNDMGFETPEECMEFLVSSLAEEDMERAMQAFAIDHMVSRYSLASLAERLGAWDISWTMEYPSGDNEIYTYANKKAMEDDIATQISHMCFSMMVDEVYLQQKLVTVEDGAALEADFAMKDMQSFTLLEMDYMDPQRQQDESFQSFRQRDLEMYGADDMADYITLYQLGESTYQGAAVFIQYDGLWYLMALHSGIYTSPSSNAYLIPMTEMEYEELTGEWEAAYGEMIAEWLFE